MNILQPFSSIKHFILDIDGVLTDGSLLVNADGVLLRTMHIKDGYAMQLAIKKGYTISIISGAQGEGSQKRLLGLGIQDIHLGISAKLDKLHELVHATNLVLQNTLYMGDDMPDLHPMKQVFLPCCPSDACQEIIAISKYISPFDGGKGCVRDVIEKVLKLNGHWE
jgi:3-deoxy-D-manno-octulosonate 8-phosphate phosphatase (KDO 8-P phosphatase)